MRRAGLFAALLLWPGLAAADIDERFMRDGVEGWGKRIGAQLGLPGFGRSIAVVIGVGDYTNGWSKLEAPPRDAEKMRDFLREEADFDIVVTLTDGAATRARIRRLMVEELPALIGPQDRLLFYFSGHGTQRELFGDKVVGYLALRDSAPEGYASMIDMRDVERWWEGLAHARQSLFILDACFSGLGLQGKGDELRERTLRELSRRGHHLITAGAADQESFASMSRWGGSLFTTALIDGMRGRADTANADAAEDGIVSLKELWDYVEKRVRAETPPEAMTPQLAAFEFSTPGEFFFVADPEAAKTATRARGEAAGKGEVVARAAPTPDPREMQLWNDVKESGDAAMLQHFVDAYPDSVFVPLAESRIAALGAPAAVTLTPPEELFAGAASATLNPPEKLFREPNSLAESRYLAAEQARTAGDETRAIRNYKLALTADPDHVGALAALGQMQFDGDGFVEENVPEAHRLWKRCAELGETECHYRLAKLYLDEDSGALHDPSLGRRLLEKAATAGHAEARAALEALKEELPPATDSARQAADRLYASMMRSLQNDPTGMSAASETQQIMALSSEGNPRAQVYVAVIAYAAASAAPTPETVQYALLAMQQASLSGDPLAPLLAHLVAAEYSIVAENSATLDIAALEPALRSAEDAARSGDPFAALLLASLHDSGEAGVPRDKVAARRNRDLAEQQGFDPAWLE